MSTAEDVHERWQLTPQLIENSGRAVIPVSGEIHFSRLPRARWEDRLRLMKAGGITVVACYVFWLHHEQQQGLVRFDDNLDVAAFVQLCGSVGLDVVLRIGPWAHGEARNGGFPDWVQAANVKHRTNDPAYLALVTAWFSRLGHELTGLMGPASNVVGIQLENELYDQPAHIQELKKIARRTGFSAPVWTATAWGGAELPVKEVMPVYGGYGDGFWVDAEAPWDPTFRQHYFFSHEWDDPGIGADVRKNLGGESTEGSGTGTGTGTAGYPAATCELAGGMATAYHRRPWPDARDVAAIAHNKIGNGSAWQGYYMFTGGANPAAHLQESQATGYPNDFPNFDYDFHAPVGAAGRLAGSFAQLRKQHAFLAAFGDQLAHMSSALPDRQPEDVYDTTTLRWALRSDGTAGFVFITWHQPHVPLETHQPTQFTLDLNDQTLTLPSHPVAIPPGTIAHWPINLNYNGVHLSWATASALTVVGAASHPTLVLTAEAGIPVELRFGPDTHVPGRTPAPDGTFDIDHAELPFTLTASSGNSSLPILILPPHLGDEAWALESERGRELVLSAEPVWISAAGTLSGRSTGRPAVQRYNPSSASFDDLHLTAHAGTIGLHTINTEALSTAKTVPASYGSSGGRAAAPDEYSMAGLAASFRLHLPPVLLEEGQATMQLELEIGWTGDVARLIVDGEVVNDRFWDGSPWIVEVHDAGIVPGSDVVLQILPLAKDAEVGLPKDAQRLRDSNAGALHSLDYVHLQGWQSWEERDVENSP
ncbi:beta-galactosidase [Arthrobacter sp. cf158]|uniref:beta-galactosidase n=1 Tax=Arthrobacter sp. cf158 TaxID=1761744 RepID=UPI000B8058C5|nr:beta-galactosidase [Arthrobacter sp. cf158]